VLLTFAILATEEKTDHQLAKVAHTSWAFAQGRARCVMCICGSTRVAEMSEGACRHVNTILRVIDGASVDRFSVHMGPHLCHMTSTVLIRGRVD
jgi:hypothetical protein